MKTFVIAGCMIALLGGACVSQAGEECVMPAPQKEHEWLQQLVGEWDSEVEVRMDPTNPPVMYKGTEKGHMVGGFWAMLKNKGEMMGQPFTGIMTLGYDPEKKVYVGTWVDSMTSYMWKYEGTLDETGKILTLKSEGPCPEKPGEMVKVKEVIEIKDKDHKVFTSSRKVDGEWVTGLTINYRRD